MIKQLVFIIKRMKNGNSRLRAFFVFLLMCPFLCLAQDVEDYEYERSSLHVMLESHLNSKYNDVVEQVFRQIPFPERFNDHNLGVKVFALAGKDGDQNYNIESYISQVNLGKKMVAKWFNRDKNTGDMNMELVKERGLYNATQTQVNIARASMRGMQLLEDAGELLIANTYLLVNDVKYDSKGSLLSSISLINTKIGGFAVSVTSYLYRLVWNDEIAETFYTNFYTENGNVDKDKVEAFKSEKDLFKMEYLGKMSTSTEERQLTKTKNPEKLLAKVITRAIDQNLAHLQHEHPDFRIKAPLTSVEPLKAYVGLKEDITPQSRFEVLERIIDKEGRLSYKRVGIIKPVASHIWDNRYMADDMDADYRLGYTEFEKVSGGTLLPGMLIREMEPK